MKNLTLNFWLIMVGLLGCICLADYFQLATPPFTILLAVIVISAIMLWVVINIILAQITQANREIAIVKDRPRYIALTLRFKFIENLKQLPPDYDFHITPALVFAHNTEFKSLGWAYGLGIAWGYWAVAVGVYGVYIKTRKNHDDNNG